MNENQSAAYIFCMGVAAMAEIEAMKAENEVRRIRDESPAHGYDEFMAVIERHEIHHNGILGWFQSCDRY